MTRSMSSEKRWIRSQAFESEVPPLKVRWPCQSGNENRTRSVKQTQKSFSMLAAGRRSRASACWNATARSAADRVRN